MTKLNKNNSKEVVKAIREHIADFYEVNDLIDQINSMVGKYNNGECATVYHTIKYLVEGGCFLIPNYEIENFFKELNIKYPTNDNQKMFELYCHLIAREGEKLYNQNIDYYNLEELTVNIEVKRVNNSTNGNPRYQIVSWDNDTAIDRLLANKTITELKSGLHTACDAGYVYGLLNDEGVNIGACKVLIKATKIYN